MKGQTLIATILMVVGSIAVAAISNWAISSTRTGVIETNIAVIKTTESDHYLEIQKQLDSVNKKLDLLLTSKEKK